MKSITLYKSVEIIRIICSFHINTRKSTKNTESQYIPSIPAGLLLLEPSLLPYFPPSLLPSFLPSAHLVVEPCEGGGCEGHVHGVHALQAPHVVPVLDHPPEAGQVGPDQTSLYTEQVFLVVITGQLGEFQQ